MPEPIRPSLYSCIFGQDLCDAAVEAILARTGEDPLKLSEAILLLPNNRAIQSMTEAFVRRLKPGLLLPRMAALGDLALQETLGPLFDPIDAAGHIPPVIEPMSRLLLLAQLVMKQRSASGSNITPTEALKLARYLVQVLDELEAAQVSFDRFDIIKPDGQDLASHWQNSYTQLLHLVPLYHAELARLGVIDAAARRNMLLENFARRLREDKPQQLIVAIGVSTDAPAIAAVLKQVALLPNSMVILPALDMDMADEEWDKIGPHEPASEEMRPKPAYETHPQYHLKSLLNAMDFSRDEVELLPDRGKISGQAIRHIFCLPDATAQWQALPVEQKKLPNMRLMICEDSAQEALSIAILIRKALEQPQRRIALITPDRELAMRTAAQLKRWNIAVDDSAGRPLIQSPPALFVMALADCYAHDFAPVPLLAALKHPLAHSGEGRTAWLKQVRALDMLLRGPNEGIGLAAIAEKISLEKAKRDGDRGILTPEQCSELQEWWPIVAADLKPLEQARDGNVPAILAAVQDVAGKLSDNAVWRENAGRQLAAFFEDLGRNNLSVIGKPVAEAIPSILTELMADQSVRLPYGGHPRIAIYGLLEARLQRADMLICAGLNEGSWPQLQNPDPWLAPRIRRDLGLAAPERNIGLSAHDLASALGAEEVVLSRAKRDRSGPTVASRFLLRIQSFLGPQLAREVEAAELAAMLDKPSEYSPNYRRPAPKPPAEQRHVSVSITQFDTLKSNPYSFYASKIMGLNALDAVDAEPSHAWRGTMIHRILELWHKDDHSEPAALIQRAEDMLSNTALNPALRAMWQPRISEALRWIAKETQRFKDEQGRTVLAAEAAAQISLAGVKLRGRADRIDKLSDGSLVIADYKTGTAPSGAKVAAGFALQLGLLGLMAERGGIEGVSGTASGFEYWSTSKNKSQFGQVTKPTSADGTKNTILTSEFVDFAERQALQLLDDYINGTAPFTAMLEPAYAYGDHNQLMRLQEWDGREAQMDGDT
ncbi:double-strand break repair protein AddB [Sphingorhabdus arenilitoris]|uniref:Double-strand break repair protein AddB n=1 Tax=Sphingorhabdus arenilitoris TaxID=1490041 RepID=A0ABV8RGI6_9SPHN